MKKTGSLNKRKIANPHTPKRSKKDKMGAGYTPRVAPSWYEMEVKKKKTLRQCSRCGAVYLDNHWHTISDFAKIYAKSLPKKEIIKELCAECKWIVGGKNKTGWEGELILENLDSSDKQEILNLARNVGTRATLRDPEDQIIKIEDFGKRARITTTENQLAVSIGKQIASAFKGGKLEIIWSDEDAPARVKWTRK